MIHALFEGTLVMLLALAAGRLCSDPGRRTSLWFVALVAQPLIALTGAVGLGWQPWVLTATLTAAATDGLAAPAPSSPPFALTACLYGMGLLWRAFPWLRSMVWAHRIVASASAPRPRHWQRMNATLARSNGRRPPLLRVHAEVDAPFLVGAPRAVICIPASLEFCEPTRARHVLLHEHSHWRSNDWWRAQGVELVACVLWFHPVVHLLRTRFRRDLELACDARVVDAGADAREYADTLLQLSRQVAPSVAMALGMATTRSQLVDRIACLMDRRPANGLTRRWPLVALGAAGLAACAINPLPRVVYQLVQPPQLHVDATAPVATPAPQAPAAIAAAEPLASDDRAKTSTVAASHAIESHTTSHARPSRASAASARVPSPANVEPAPAPASSAQLYRSMVQVAREDVPWPDAERGIPQTLDAPVDSRFEAGMRKGRIERDERVERNWDRIWMVTGRIPLKPTVDKQPVAVSVQF